MIRKWDLTDEQVKRQCVDEIIARIDEQGDAAFGKIAAQDIIDIVASHLGPQVFNDTIDEIKKTVEKKLADLEVDLDVLRDVS
ncbi:MAG TPA: DUF2164 family protein [Verrucomicrobiae bacterium]|nr:DUF2164 family protein [Verrucomicrobiae bacterium]